VDDLDHGRFPASCRVFADLASARQAHVYFLGIIDEKDMPTRPLRASPYIHSCEIIFGETTAEKCAN
jgi:hypothetical protein